MAVDLKTGDVSELRILVVAADPTISSNEHLEEEANIIGDALDQIKNIQREIHVVNTLSRQELFETFESFRPDVIDITSHGSPSQKMLLEGQRGWVRNITGSALAQGIRKAVGRIDCLFFNNCTVSRSFGVLSEVARIAVRFIYPSSGIDISPIVARRFFQSLGETRDFGLAFSDVSSEFGREDQFRAVKAEFVLEGRHDEKSGIAAEDRKLPLSGVSGSSADYAAGVELTQTSDTSGPRIYRVWYGTNRRPVSADTAGITYGSERDTGVHIGYCDVTIPKYHTIGSVGEPWWRRFPRFQRNNRLAVQRRICLDEDRYWQDLLSVFERLPEEDRVLLLFVHGYNVTFDQAAVRAAQLGFDLSIKGVTAFFSWPSKGLVKGYAADVAALEAAEEALGNFIIEMVNRNGLKKAHLIAHSMGNRGLLRAFSDMLQRISVSIRISLQQIFLAAPDVDIDVFKRLAAIFPQVSTRTTMYVSDKDKALWSSGIIHDHPRAGYVPPITVVDGIDTVHVSAIDLSFLGHGYIAEARPVLQDIHTLIESDSPPDRRFGLERMIGSPIYWRIRA